MVSFLIKLHVSSLELYLKGDSSTGFSCEFYEILNNTFFTEHLRTTASGMKIVGASNSKLITKESLLSPESQNMLLLKHVFMKMVASRSASAVSSR